MIPDRDRMSGYTIVVSGEARPEAKRQRFLKRKGGAVVVGARTDLPDRADWKAYVRHEARLVCDAPMEGPLTLSVTFTLVRPPSWSKRPTKAYPWPDQPYKKPDLDNLIKPIKDALTGIAWGDDAQVVAEGVFKRWGDRHETTIEVRPADAFGAALALAPKLVQREAAA